MGEGEVLGRGVGDCPGGSGVGIGSGVGFRIAGSECTDKISERGPAKTCISKLPAPRSCSRPGLRKSPRVTSVVNQETASLGAAPRNSNFTCSPAWTPSKLDKGVSEPEWNS